MNPFIKLGRPIISQDFELRFGGRLARDAEGCLYDPRLRELMRSMASAREPDLAGFEALGALRASARGLRLLMNRWAGQHDLSEGTLQVLFRLRRVPEQQLALNELAGALDVTPRNITGLIDQLEKRGLVRRVPDSADRRSVHARLTPAGLAKVEQLWREALRTQHPVLTGFSHRERVQLRHLCFRLVENMVRLRAAAGSPGARR